jgi:hypothetical protein
LTGRTRCSVDFPLGPALNDQMTPGFRNLCQEVRNQATALVLRFKAVGMLGVALILLVLMVRNSIAALPERVASFGLELPFWNGHALS